MADGKTRKNPEIVINTPSGVFCVTLTKTSTLKARPFIETWLVSVLVVGWVWLFGHIFNQPFETQAYAVAFVIAPIFEELFYRWLPVYLGRKAQQHTGVDYSIGFGCIANFLFIALHTNNYPYAGMYWAYCIQGVMGFACLYLCRKYGYWFAVGLHCKYNIAVNFLL